MFYGIRDGPRLLAAAGTHVVSARYAIAAVGNIFTRPAARGGLAGRGHAVVADFGGAERYRDVILNVGRANVSAQRVYARLGFREHLRHFEGIWRRWEADAPSPSRAPLSLPRERGRKPSGLTPEHGRSTL